jgi:hypothetical protein
MAVKDKAIERVAVERAAAANDAAKQKAVEMKPLKVVVWIAQHANRLPVILRAYGCSPGLQLIILVGSDEQIGCLSLLRAARPHGACVRPQACQCQVAKWSAQQQLANVAPFADGLSDMVFTHADLWFNLSLLNSWRRLRNHSASPRGGLGMVEPYCHPLRDMMTCQTVGDGNTTCAGRQWHWWSNSAPQCLQLASLANLTSCCYAWSDWFFVPKTAHAALRSLANSFKFRFLFHEVAVPTVLHALNLPRWGGTPHAMLPCTGSCCTQLTDGAQLGHAGGSWRQVAPSASMCAHRLSLGYLASRQRSTAYPGFYDPVHACSSDLFSDAHIVQNITLLKMAETEAAARLLRVSLAKRAWLASRRRKWHDVLQVPKSRI